MNSGRGMAFVSENRKIPRKFPCKQRIVRYAGGMEWKTHMTEPERERIAFIESERPRLTAEYRRIYDRCRKRGKAKSG